MELKPSEIFYSQDSIMNKFGGYTPHGNTFIGQTLDQLLSGHCNINSIPNITVVQKNGKLFTSDNRRLWVFRKAEELGFLKSIPVTVSYYLNEDKFTTINGGTSIRVRGGGPGGSLWRTWKPRRHIPVTNSNLNQKRVISANRSTSSFSSIHNDTRYVSRQNKNISSSPSISRTQSRTSTSPDYRRPDSVRSHGLSYTSNYHSVQPKIEDTHIRSFPSSMEKSVSRPTISSSTSRPYQDDNYTREHSRAYYDEPKESFDSRESYNPRNQDFIRRDDSPRVPPNSITRQPMPSTKPHSEMYRSYGTHKDVDHGCCIIL